MNDQSLMLVTNVLLGMILNLALYAVALSYPEPLRRSQRIWAGAGIWIVATWVFLSTRGFVYEPVAVIGPNMMLGYALAEYSRALRVFVGKPTSHSSSLICSAVFGATAAFFYWLCPDQDLRAAAINLLATMIIAWACFNALSARLFSPISARLLVATLAAISVIQLIRCIYIVISMPSAPGTMMQSLPQQLLTAASTACFAVLAIAFALLCNERINAELRRRVRYDSLTGALNRAPWRAEFDANFESRRSISVLLFDIDHFKSVNDRYGHDAGDAVLQAITSCACAMFGDQVGRLGGEEFAIMIFCDSKKNGLEAAEGFRRAVSRLVIVHGQDTIAATVSIGVADVASYMSAKDALKAADDAMYGAKRAGRNICLAAVEPIAPVESSIIQGDRGAALDYT